MHTLELTIKTTRRTEALEITEQVRAAVRAAGVDAGLVHCFVPHTTAALTLNERLDPNVIADLVGHLERLVPWTGEWTHQGNAAAHVKAGLLGHEKVLAVAAGDLVLGEWQGLFLCEFHGPRARTVRLAVQAG